MKELARFTLSPAQVKEACEAYVAPRIDASCEEATATTKMIEVVVVINRKPAPRKPRDRSAAALLAPAEAGPVGSSS